MKWIIALTAFLAVSIIAVDAACDLGEPFDYDPEQVQRQWTLEYAPAIIFAEFLNSSVVFNLQGNSSFDGRITTTFVLDRQRHVLDSQWQIVQSNNSLIARITSLPKFNGSYRITATDYNYYLVLIGCPLSFSDQALLLVFFTQIDNCSQCLEAATAALERQNLSLKSLAKDPTLDGGRDA